MKRGVVPTERMLAWGNVMLRHWWSSHCVADDAAGVRVQLSKAMLSTKFTALQSKLSPVTLRAAKY